MHPSSTQDRRSVKMEGQLCYRVTEAAQAEALEGRSGREQFWGMDREARGRDGVQSRAGMNRRGEHTGVKQRRRRERERGQRHAADLGLYFQGDKRPIADWLMGAINSRSPRCVGI